jgi:hypothetical protein
VPADQDGPAGAPIATPAPGRGSSATLGGRIIPHSPPFFPQFFEQGCDNCEKFLKLEGDREKVYGFTSSAFSG